MYPITIFSVAKFNCKGFTGCYCPSNCKVNSVSRQCLKLNRFFAYVLLKASLSTIPTTRREETCPINTFSCDTSRFPLGMEKVQHSTPLTRYLALDFSRALALYNYFVCAIGQNFYFNYFTIVICFNFQRTTSVAFA